MREKLKAAMFFIGDIESITRRSRRTLRRMWDKGEFPKPVIINKRCAWKRETVEQWIEKNMGVK